MPSPIRVLIMLDYGATFGPGDLMNNPNDNYFTLSEVVRTLQDSAEPLEFEITKAHRGVDPLYPPGALVPVDRQRFLADYSNYRFDQHDLSGFDQIWFFGVAVGDTNGLGVPSTLSQAEIDAVFAFMQGGGGVFATGDHWDMGAPLCGFIPRVRSMRRWFYGDAANRQNTPDYDNEGVDLGPFKGLSAPSALGEYRHDTTQPDIHGLFPFDAQSDAIAQPLDVVYARGGSIIQWKMPHALLCSSEGTIDTFPDHMHEGEVCEPLDRDWGNTVPYLGGMVHEYPFAMAGTTVEDGVTKPNVRPQIIAWGSVIPGHRTPSSEMAHVGEPTYDTLGDTFGTLCVYDGVLEGVGRVVTDSTFHHYFDINLSGDPVASAEKLYGFLQPVIGGYTDGPMMRKMRAFFRNIAVWLARPASQAALLTRAAALAAAGQPFNELAPAEAAYSDDAVMALGAEAVVSLRRLGMLCWTITGISIILYYRYPHNEWPPPGPDPWWWHVYGGDPYEGVVQPIEVAQAMLGGVIAEFRGPGFKALRDRKHEKAFAALEKHVEAGFQRGAKALATRLERRSEKYARASLAALGSHALGKRARANAAAVEPATR
ncbi:MAG TPA: hypothetical protein VGD01_19455 [Candidatus Elarobacter sp.]|jgi:hypothetical protein